MWERNWCDEIFCSTTGIDMFVQRTWRCPEIEWRAVIWTLIFQWNQQLWSPLFINAIVNKGSSVFCIRLPDFLIFNKFTYLRTFCYNRSIGISHSFLRTYKTSFGRNKKCHGFWIISAYVFLLTYFDSFGLKIYMGHQTDILKLVLSFSLLQCIGLSYLCR